MATLKARINLTCEFQGKSQTSTMAAAKLAAGALSQMINEKFQDRKGGIFLTVKSVEDVKILTSKQLIKKAKG